MAATAEIKAVITADDRASGVIQGFGKTSAAVFGVIAGIAQSVTARAIDTISSAIGTAVKRVDTLNNSSRVFANMGFKADDVKSAMDKLNNSILGLPTSLDGAVRGMQMIGSTTGDIGKAQSVFSALNDAIIGFGGSADMVDNAVLQLSQAFSNGRIDAQTWNSMMQSGLGPTLNAIAKQMGITTGALKDGLSNSSISVGKFQDALVALDTKGGGGLKSLQTIAHDATAGIGTGIENAKTAIARGMAKIIESIGSENISKAISSIGTFFENLATKLAGIMPKIVDFFKKIGSAAKDIAIEAWPKVIGAFNELVSTTRDWIIPALEGIKDAIIRLHDQYPLLTEITAGVVALGIAFSVNPIVTIIGAIITAIVLLHQHWDEIVLFFTTTKDQMVKTFHDIFDPWMPLLNVIGAILNEAIIKPFKELWHTIQDQLWPAFKNLWDVLSPMLIPILQTLGAILLGVLASGLAAAVIAIRILTFVVTGAIDVLSAIINTIAGVVAAFTGQFNKIPGIVGDALKNIYDIITRPFKDAFDWVTNGAKNIGKSISDGIGNATGNLKLPGFAGGVSNFGGGLAIVGERGPELVSLPRGSSVTPNDQLSTAVTQTGANININISGAFMGTPDEARSFARKIVSGMQDIANAKNTTVAEMLS